VSSKRASKFELKGVDKRGTRPATLESFWHGPRTGWKLKIVISTERRNSTDRTHRQKNVVGACHRGGGSKKFSCVILNLNEKGSQR